MKKQVLRLLLTGAMFLVPWVTQAQTIGFTCGFENDSDTAGWTIYNGSQPSVWTIGTAVNNGGTKSLYVSDDGGTSNNYSGGTSIVYAVKTISLDAGGYELSYDWRCQGEGSYDLMRVALRRNDPSYLANRVYNRRGAENAGTMRSLIQADLNDTRTWYLNWGGKIGLGY